MARKRDNRHLAKLVTEDRAPCAFCRRVVDDEVTYGNLYAIGGIQCHYLCVLLSCCLVQKGPEDSGLFGFMYEDILAELERSKKHKCSFCGCGGANLGCCVGSCRKQFHLPCGRERNAVSLFYGSYKSFCQVHAPKQKIPEHIMCKAKLRMKDDKNKNNLKNNADNTDEDIVCVICYESVDAFPTINTFWPPCCARDAWFHRSCVQRMALSAGMHYLKCPLCNDKENFYDAVVSQGYYVPDRDAAWELEQNAFAEIYERPLTCTADICHCPMGREHDADLGMWSIKLCLLCGSVGAHAHCMGASETTRHVCLTCTPARPTDMQALTDNIDKLILQEQANSANSVRHGPVMPSRMSLRRTKGRIPILNRPSCSGAYNMKTECESSALPSIQSSRQELNLKTPRRKTEHLSPKRRTSSYKSPEKSPIKPEKSNDSYKIIDPVSYKSVESNMKVKMSPMKVLEQSIRHRFVCMGGNVLDERMVDMMRCRFRKPRPLCAKKKIVDEILKDLLNNLISPLKQKEQLREWCSPRKCCDISEEKQNDIRAGDNATKDTENTVENKENHMQETPHKKKISQNSTPRKIVTTPRSENSKVRNKATNNNTLEKEVVHETNAHEGIKEISDEKHQTNAEIQEVDDEEYLANIMPETDATNDDSSNSTFQLPSEFIAEAVSDDSCFTFASPKRKTIEMKDSSLEISEQDHSVNIDVIKIPDSPASSPDVKKCAFKFSRLDKEGLEDKVRIDLESFKKGYLSEVDREYKCSFNHNHNTNKLSSEKSKLRTVIDFAIDAHKHKHNTAVKNDRKRKFSEEGLCNWSFDREAKSRKMSENDLNLSGDDFEVKKKLSYKKNVSPSKKVVQDRSSEKINRNKKSSRQRRRERENRERKCILEKERAENINSNDETQKQERNLLDRKLEGKKHHIKENLMKKIKSNDANPKVIKEKILLGKKIEGKEQNNIREAEIKEKSTKKIRFDDKIMLKEKRNMLNRNLEENLMKTIKSNNGNRKAIKEINLFDKAMEVKEQINIRKDETKEKRTKKVTSNDRVTLKEKRNLEGKKQRIENNLKKKIILKYYGNLNVIHEKSLLDSKLEEKEQSIKIRKGNIKEKRENRKLKEEKSALNRKQEKIKIITQLVTEKHGKAECKEFIKHKNHESKQKRNKDGKEISKRIKVMSASNNEENLKDKTNVDEERKTRKDKDKKLKRSDKHAKDKKHRSTEKYAKGNDDRNIEVTIDSSESKLNQKTKTKLSIKNSEKDISVKIKWKKKHFRLKIESKKEKAEKYVQKDDSKFKQYVLQYFSEISPKQVLVKPEQEVSPLKRKYVKQEKTPDNLKQMSISNFFKVKSPE